MGGRGGSGGGGAGGGARLSGTAKQVEFATSLRKNANNVISWGKKEAESNPQYKLLSSAQKTASNKRFSDLKKAINEETSASSIIDKMKGINFSDTSKNGKAQAFTQLVRKYT